MKIAINKVWTRICAGLDRPAPLVRCGTCGRLLPASEFSPSNLPYTEGGSRRSGRCRRCEADRECERSALDVRHDAAARRVARQLAAGVWQKIMGEDLPPCHVVHADGDDRNNDLGNLVLVLDGGVPGETAVARTRRLGATERRCGCGLCLSAGVPGALPLDRLAHVKDVG